MNELIREWICAQDHTRNARIEEKKALDKAESAGLPKGLVKAQSKDITQGNVIWYPEWDGDRSWNVVDEVLCPNDNWKAYCAHDGCRYGLEGAFVEKAN